MLAFITVGSTRFDALVQTVFSSTVLSSLSNKGYARLVVQCGNSEFPYKDRVAVDGLHLNKDGVQIECWKFKPSLQTEYAKADLVISHAGSGTIVDVLRMDKPLIVIPNPTLLDNHQQELAEALGELGHLKVATIETLSQTILDLDSSSLVKFPPFDGSRFRDLIDKEMGFI
ncbi:glycosyltransferase family 1 protein [Collybiopsis luxurians FD-317 M1]|uniref:UDP-N-acetylglucosamine transferase subunit ALG13 n=1 Tax=Collybiopsis luxurians FD-317 M1 TaxID=944289 RepID=A0A0D0BW57_9AGAR|nr:glycosyltransferase family 1 protein [Collybiopsis luxurians FD-317 M1]